MENQSAGWRLKLALAGIVLAVFAVIWFAAAALGSKYGLWGWQFGLGTMTITWGPRIAMLAMGVSALGLIAGLTRAPRTKPFILGLAGLLIGGLVLGRLAAFGAQASRLPPIHDVQTDWSEPIQFSDTLMAIREADGAQNPVVDAPTITEGADARWPGFGGRLVSEVQEEAEWSPERQEDPIDAPYPYEIQPLRFDAPSGEVFNVAQSIVEQRGWEVVTADAGSGVIEATETSGWFGFKDDVAIRVRDEDGRTRVDVRSVSRVGLSDLGANAKRVDEFVKDLGQRLTDAN